MIDRFQKEFQRLCASSEVQKVLVAISGGLDSVVLAHLLHQSGQQIILAHVNFTLRAEESDGDEQFVREFGKDLGVEVFVKRFETADYAVKNHLSIQVAARNLRYQWFEQLAEEQNCDYIAVAHHQDDQIETFFINLFRGSGMHGLKGMPEKNGKIIRPLLFAQRDEIEQYATKLGLSWRNDSSNTKDDYLRNRLRNNILPEIYAVSPSARTGIVHSLKHLAANEKLFNELISEKKTRLIHTESEMHYMLKSELSGIHRSDELLYEILRDYGCNESQTDAISSKIESGPGAVFYSQTHSLFIDRERIEIKKFKEKVPEKIYFLEQETRSITEPFKLQTSILECSVNFVPERNPVVATFDLAEILFPIQIRRWQTGDRFIPFGMTGSKLVSDYFTDRHFTRSEKENSWLLCDRNGLILWVIGHRQSEIGRITSKTLKVYQLRQE